MKTLALLLALCGPASAAPVDTSSGAGAGYAWRMAIPRTGLAPADAAMRAWSQTQLKEFMSRLELPPANPDWRYEFILTASSYAPSAGALSWRLDAWSFTGGAHGGTESESFVYDRSSGKRLALSDLFKPGTPYLRELSRRAMAQRLARAVPGVDKDWLDRGAGPDPENYRLFALDGGDLVVRFPAYQVAPYSEGPQDFRAPLKTLNGLASPP